MSNIFKKLNLFLLIVSIGCMRFENVVRLQNP